MRAQPPPVAIGKIRILISDTREIAMESTCSCPTCLAHIVTAAQQFYAKWRRGLVTKN